MIALLPVCALGCALGYRIRGGLLEDWHVPGQVSRMAFALAGALTAAAAGAGWLETALLVPALWVGTTFPLFGGIDLGGNQGSFWGDFAKLAARGVLGMLFAAGALAWFGHGWAALLGAGALMPVCYWAGRQTGGLTVPGRALGTARDFPPRGEAAFGALAGVGMFMAVWLG